MFAVLILLHFRSFKKLGTTVALILHIFKLKVYALI
jgi:hypothetical protein